MTAGDIVLGRNCRPGVSLEEKLEFLLDLAHMNDYGHLDRLVKVKKPAKIHLADRHLEALH